MDNGEMIATSIIDERDKRIIEDMIDININIGSMIDIGIGNGNNIDNDHVYCNADPCCDLV